MATPKNYPLRVAGDRWTFTEDMPAGCYALGTVFWMELKRFADTPSPGYGVASNNLTAIANSDTNVTFTFAEEITRVIPGGRIWYEIKMSTILLGVVTVYSGCVDVHPWASDTPEVPTFAVVDGSTEFGFETEGSFLIANAGPDQPAFAFLGASPCQLAGSGSGNGTLTYAWTKVSGTPNVVFADATNPTTTCTFDAEGAVVLRLTVTHSTGSSTANEVTITSVATLTDLLTRMASGSRVNVWYEVGVSAETLDGSNNFSQLNDMGSAGLHLTQSNSGLRPSKVVGGGPNGKNCITLQDNNRTVNNTSAGIASGKFLYFTSVAKMGTTNDTGPSYVLGTGLTRIAWFNSRKVGYASAYKFCSGDATHVPGYFAASDESWCRWDQRYVSGALPIVRRNGVAQAAPEGLHQQFTGETGACNTSVEKIALGLGLTFSGGSVYSFGMFENVTTTAGSACLSEQDAIDYYQDKQAGFAHPAADNKWLGFTGQSNAWWEFFGYPQVSATTQLYRSAEGGKSLGVFPFDWWITDPHGWWAATAASQLASGFTNATMVFWQGEADANAHSNHYGADLQAVIAYYDSLVGHSNTFWVIPRLNINYTFAGTSPADVAAIRAGQAAAAAAMPTRIALIDIDDLPMRADFAHYPATSYTTAFARCLAASAAHFGDSSWVP